MNSKKTESIVKPRMGPTLRRLTGWLAAHLVAAFLCAVATVFTVWFVLTNPALPGLFGQLLGSWSVPLDRMEWGGLLMALAAAAFMTVLGRFFLESLELYMPRAAVVCLSFLFGMGLAGVGLELLAIPWMLNRLSIALVMGLLLLVLMVLARRRARRPTESGLGGESGVEEYVLRHALARQSWRQSLARPRGIFGQAFKWLAVLLTGAITLGIFWHALLYPEVYWDSLILYLGYARMTFLEHGFPIKVTGQVGIGLGANYPHLYSLLGSGAATVAGQWSELPQRLIAPLAGLATTVLIYQTVLRLTRHINFSLTVALLYRSIPLGIAYDQYASDYAVAILFAAGFLYLSLLYIETGLKGYLIASGLLIGLGMHLNYLMGILWLPWAVTVWAAHAGWPRGPMPPPKADSDAPWTFLIERQGLLSFMTSRRLWGIILAGMAIGAIWLVRNWIVTGNPVYAFFYKSLGGRNINPQVMEAAAVEWQANGAGIGRLGATVQERLGALWTFFAGPGVDADGKPFYWHQYYRTAPLLMGFSLGGGVAWLGCCIAAFVRRRRGERPATHLRWGAAVAVLAVALLAFHIVLAPFYLYQIIMLLPCLALMVGFAWPFWRLRPWRWGLGLLALWGGLVPGLAMSLMGFKIVNRFEVAQGQWIESPSLFVLRHPLPRPEQFYAWRYGEDARMWDYINTRLKDEKLLTHENRDLVLDPSIQIVNLDDWDMQPLWDVAEPAERVRRLIQAHGIHYYLRVPNEDACPTNARMGAADWPKLGLADLVYEAGENRLYRLRPPVASESATTPTLNRVPPRP